jgi:glucose-1-phosphate adenylyltransferase
LFSDFAGSISKVPDQVNGCKKISLDQIRCLSAAATRNIFYAQIDMSHTGRQPINVSKVLCVIMGGGQGTRLFPLTKDRAKPAVPLAGKYRLVDIPISNCINSGFRRIYILTQFNSTSLHGHISRTYKFDHFTSGFVEILAAQQTLTNTSWYEGTADAVRKNLIHFLNHDFDYLLILSGDQLYRMDYRLMLAQHIETGADITVATIPVGRKEAHSFGIMQIAEDRRITRFEEKPKDPALLDSLHLQPEWHKKLGIKDGGELFLASMGIYVFNRQLIRDLLDNPLSDFGKHIIPHAINSQRVFSYIFQGYWEDIGTIRSFFEASLDLVSELPRFNFFDMSAPIFSRPRYLPGSKINGAQIEHALVTDGCIINQAQIKNTIVGLRTFIGAGTQLNRVIILGSDDYENQESIQKNEREGKPRIGIGANCRIENAIIDKNARIGDNVTISPAGKSESVDHELYFIRDGIVIIPKNAVIKHGTVI